MALTEKNQLLIAFKKLYGKSHTSAKFGIFNESIGTSVQVGLDKIFGDQVPSSPSGSLYSITNNVVEKVKFSLVPISLSTYASTLGGLSGTTIDDEGDTAVNGVHAYRLVLPSDYETSSSNSKKGTGYFTNSSTSSISNGSLQLVPPSFSDLYTAEISSSSGIIGGLDDEDYYLDYYSGVLFIQDIGRTPTAVSAYLYVGSYGAVSSSFATTASYAVTASYAQNTSFDTTNIENAHKRLRYQEVGYFNSSGEALIQLPTSSYGNDSFITSSINYINVDARIKDGNLWVNDLLAVSLFSSSSAVYISLYAPDLTNTDQYRILATNEDPSCYII